MFSPASSMWKIIQAYSTGSISTVNCNWLHNQSKGWAGKTTTTSFNEQEHIAWKECDSMKMLHHYFVCAKRTWWKIWVKTHKTYFYKSESRVIRIFFLLLEVMAWLTAQAAFIWGAQVFTWLKSCLLFYIWSVFYIKAFFLRSRSWVWVILYVLFFLQ